MDKAIKYKRTIENWDDLMDPRTLAFYCLEPEPSAFICTILKLKEKRVSVRFFNTDFLIYTCVFFFFLQVFFSCRNDNQIQQRLVCKDENEEA